MSFEKEIEKIARLARLELTKEEKEKLAKELNSVLGYFASIQEVNLEGVEPAQYPLNLKNVFREDKSEEFFDSQKLKMPFLNRRKVI